MASNAALSSSSRSSLSKAEPTSEPTPEPADENALTEEELAEFNGMLATIVNMGEEDAYVSDVSCFFTSYYDDPRDLDLRYFLRYYP